MSAAAGLLPGTLRERRVLLAEDELLVAMELEAMLRDLGCEVIGPAATVDEALHLARAEAGPLDAAVLDINLAGQASFPVADLLAGRNVPVVFATGHSDFPAGRMRGGQSLLLRKPLGRGALAAALARLLAPALSATAVRQTG
jgi:DNA-binding NarL/FixJ family response regulator